MSGKNGACMDQDRHPGTGFCRSGKIRKGSFIVTSRITPAAEQKPLPQLINNAKVLYFP